jgi:tetratricopeptide (TPR) repeat protein
MPAMRTTISRPRPDNRLLAQGIGERLRRARQKAGLTQQALAGDRYTKAYVSALEHALAKPSMAALTYFAERLSIPPSALLADPAPTWTRLEADLHLASGELTRAVDGYTSILEGAIDRAAKAEVSASLAEAMCRLGRPAEAIRPATEAAREFTELGRDIDRARAEYWLASAHHQEDNPAEARSILRDLVDRVRAGLVVEPDFHIRVLIALGMVESFQGSTSAALAYLEEARGMTADLDTRRRGMFLASLADGYRQSGDFEAAIRSGLQAQALLRAAQAETEASLLDNQLALAYLETGSTSRARELVDHARAEAAARGNTRLVSQLTDTAALVALGSDRAADALELADEAIALAEESGVQKGILDALVTRARALDQLGRHEDAAASFSRAADLAREIAPPSRRREVLSAWADTLAALGRHDEAYALAREALAAERR